ncbi:MAG: TA system VapC family ribonuclease toxin [Acidimicrobiia bacterium]
MLIDANLLLLARDSSSPFHATTRRWIDKALNGPTRVGIPWKSLVAFVRISTNPRAYENPLSDGAARSQVSEWLSASATWIPRETDSHWEILSALIATHRLSGNLISDAHLAAMAIGHGLDLYSADSDFARFPEITWVNPLRE